MKMNHSRKGVSRKKKADRLEKSIRDTEDRAIMAQITATIAVIVAIVDFIIHFV